MNIVRYMMFLVLGILLGLLLSAFSFLKSGPVQTPRGPGREWAYGSRSPVRLFNPARIPAIGGPPLD
jgi:hypothetical protein